MAFGREPLDDLISLRDIFDAVSVDVVRVRKWCEMNLGFGAECACGAVRGAEAAPPAQRSSSFTISKVSPQSSPDEVKAKANLPLEEVDLRADKTSNSCVRHTIKRSQREKSSPRLFHAVLPIIFVNS